MHGRGPRVTINQSNVRRNAETRVVEHARASISEVVRTSEYAQSRRSPTIHKITFDLSFQAAMGSMLTRSRATCSAPKLKICLICADDKPAEEFNFLHSECSGASSRRAVCTTCVKKHAQAEITGKMGVRVACPFGPSICTGELTGADMARFGCNDMANLLADNQMRAWTSQQVGWIQSWDFPEINFKEPNVEDPFKNEMSSWPGKKQIHDVGFEAQRWVLTRN